MRPTQLHIMSGTAFLLLLAACGKNDTAPITSGDLNPVEPDDEDDDASAKDDGREPTREPQCKAGYYTGTFAGNYRPGAFGLGLFASSLDVDISGDKSFFDDSLPPLSFMLTESSEGQGEFATFKVGGGCMQGLATAAVVTQSPFVARLTGDLDCGTGKFEGKLEGYYTLVGIPGADFSFSGPITGQFELADSSLQGGAWIVEEPPAANGEAAGGGDGSWGAKWAAETAPDLGKPDPCADIAAHGGSASDDAGTSAAP